MSAYTGSEVAQMISSGTIAPDVQRMVQEWVDRHIATCPPLSEAQKAVIRTAFAADRAERALAA